MTQPNRVIRRANHGDIDQLILFNQAMALETEGKTLATTTLQRGVKAVLDDPSLGFYLVAENANETVGSLMITTEWSDWRAKHFWWIQSVFVAKAARRQGVYRALFQEVQNLATADGEVAGIRLYVEKNNYTAQTTYQQLGMHENDYILFENHLFESHSPK